MKLGHGLVKVIKQKNGMVHLGLKAMFYILHSYNEEGRPEVEGRILQCKSKELIELKLGTTEDSWIIKLVLNEVLDGTKVTLYQDKTGTKIDPWIEAGWVFYLDCLLAAVNKTVMPMFEDYAPEGDAPTYEG